MPNPSQFNIDRTNPGLWTITFSNPPINMFVPTTIVELGALMTDLEADPSVKVVVFQSANPDFFIAHLDVSKAAERPGVLDLWHDFVLCLSSTSVAASRLSFACCHAIADTASHRIGSYEYVKPCEAGSCSRTVFRRSGPPGIR
jgi:enoyl-CoA hydratase/carnithine racemase